MNPDWFEILVKGFVLALFAAMIVGASFFCYVTLVKGWVGKPPVHTLANVTVSATISLLVVLVLKYTAGEIEFEVWQLKFRVPQVQ